MRISFFRIAPLAGLLPLLISVPSAAVTTFHELRITSITALTVAQQITQPSVCTNPNTCLHNEIRLGVKIDFDTGVIAIDARAPEDENGNLVLPSLPGGILFNTLSGPAEMAFAEPCENPDGCPLGEALYIGTIDQGGNISFPSVGLNFELFGVSPISKFRGPMGTGPSSDPADPGVIAEGAALDFTTGELLLAGIDFIPAPIVGTTLQLDRIRGTLVPVPLPPAEVKDLLACQRSIEKGAASFVRTKQSTLQDCVDELLACEVGQETGGAEPGCIDRAKSVCDRMEIRTILAEQALSRRIVRGCQKVGPANMIAVEGGLGLGLVKPECDRLDIGTAMREDIADCIGRVLSCKTEEIVARLKPRAYEVLVTNGYDAFVAPDGCVPVFAAGNATGLPADDLLDCQAAIESQGARYGKTKQIGLQACMAANLACHLPSEVGEMPPVDDACTDKARQRCDSAVRKIAAAETAKLQAIQRACEPLDAAGIPALRQGLGFANLIDHCQELDPSVTLNSVDDLIECTSRSIDCSIEGIARSMIPRGHEVLHHHGMEDVLDRYPCLHDDCGDGFLDPDEECDPLFDPDLACNSDCTMVVCGDGLQQGNEECDDGNILNDDGCDSNCEDEPFACGNGVVEFFAGEVCDDSDSAAGDGCNADCQSKEICGNGVVDTIRGETCDDGGADYVATLTGAEEVPPVVTAASGSATLTLNGDDTLSYSVATTGLVGIAAHIHLGAMGVDGPILIPLAGGPTTWAGSTGALTAEQQAQLKAGLFYINVHTAANPDGEVRGQIGFEPPVDGDGCSATCRSNETCGNGVVDAVTGEACDDGDLTSGDGCDSSCQFESCSFFSTGAPLGTRTFSIVQQAALWNSILGLGFPLGGIPTTSGPMSFTATGTDASGRAMVTLDSDVIVTIDIGLGGQTQCLKFEAAGSTGTLNCCGGHAAGVTITRDSNTGGVPTSTGQANGPTIQLGGVGAGGIGDLLMAFSVRQFNGPLGTNCLTATFGPPSTQLWTTANATAQVIRPLQGGPTLTFGTNGEAFDCAAWTTEHGPGAFVSAEVNLNAIAGADAATVRKLDD